MGKHEELDRIDRDIKTLWTNAKEMESKLTNKIDNVESKLNANNVDLKLLSKDVKSSIEGMSDFMVLFRSHDEKEMEKYESIEVSLRSLDSKVSSYSAVTDTQIKDIGYLKTIAEKGKLYMIRGTWTVTILGVLMSFAYVVSPFAKEYIIAKAARDGRLYTPRVYSPAEKSTYYDKIVKDRMIGKD